MVRSIALCGYYVREVGVCCVRVVKTTNVTCVFFCVVKIIFLFAVCFSLLDRMG